MLELETQARDVCDGDTLHEECGVFGVWAPDRDVARLTYFGLRALQHRGQDSAGIAVGDGATVLVRKDLGLVNQVFNDADLAALSGKCAVGHVRYGTSGCCSFDGAQPHLSAVDDVIIALAHNGTLVNSNKLRGELVERNVPFRSNTDSEVAARLIGHFTKKYSHITDGIKETMRLIKGGYAMILIRENAVYAFRDPNGIRPLMLGHIEAEADKQEAWVVASETCAFDIVGADFIREIEPGEIVRISDDGVKCTRGIPALRKADCIFEHVYFARPDSILYGSSVYRMRYNMGVRLAQEAPADVDMVIGVPDSGMPPAEGFAHELGIPFGEGLIKNRYVARTFIEPTQELRRLGVRMKLNALKDSVGGKRIVMVDDSIVRGTTSKQIVKLLKDAGATEVHVRINSPEVMWPCFYGIDTAEQDQLISTQKSLEEICEYIGADSLAFLSMEGLLSCVPKETHYCSACFTGEYPVKIPERFSSGKFIEGYNPVYLDE